MVDKKKLLAKHSAAVTDITTRTASEAHHEQMRPGNHYVCCNSPKEKHEYPICKGCSVSDGTSTWP